MISAPLDALPVLQFGSPNSDDEGALTSPRGAEDGVACGFSPPLFVSRAGRQGTGRRAGAARSSWEPRESSRVPQEGVWAKHLPPPGLPALGRVWGGGRESTVHARGMAGAGAS